jgi:hypothetical protein
LLANWIPDPSPEFGSSPWPFVILMLAGFVIGTFGHIIKSKPVIATGIGLIFLGTLVLPLIVNLSKQ